MPNPVEFVLILIMAQTRREGPGDGGLSERGLLTKVVLMEKSAYPTSSFPRPSCLPPPSPSPPPRCSSRERSKKCPRMTPPSSSDTSRSRATARWQSTLTVATRRHRYDHDYEYPEPPETASPFPSLSAMCRKTMANIIYKASRERKALKKTRFGPNRPAAAIGRKAF